MAQDAVKGTKGFSLVAPSLERPQPKPLTGGERENVLWSDDFSDANTWETAIWPGSPNTPWEILTPADLPGGISQGEYPTPIIASTTAANGFALLDSDFYGSSSATAIESSTLTTVNPIDLSGYDNVVLQFETYYRKWTAEEIYVVVSTTNADWPNLDPSFDVATHNATPNITNQVYYVFPGMEVQEPIANPTKVRINISDFAGGEQEVYVRFHWTGTWGYSWYVDDVSIIEQPEFDLEMNYALVSHVDPIIFPEGISVPEYGRVPSSQMSTTLYVGGGFSNFGFGEHTGQQIELEILDPADNVFHTEVLDPMGMVDTWQAITVPAMGLGLYKFNFSLVSDQEMAGSEFFDNNMITRYMEVTDDVYSLDNLGNYETGVPFISSLGTPSFTNNQEGIRLMTAYDLSAPLTVYGLEILLSTNSTPNGLINIAIFDSIHIFADTATYTPNLTSPIAETMEQYTLTAADISAGRIVMPFDDGVELEAGKIYYASVELYGSTASEIRVLDDETVPQPQWQSLIYLPASTGGTNPANRIWSNGNAFAIRFLMDPTISVPEQTKLTGVSMFPNPTTGQVNIHVAEAGIYDVEVMNVLGERIHSTRIVNNSVLDLSGQAKGVYMVRISNGNASTVERITLN